MRPPHRSHPLYPRGLTLLEVLAVIVILGLTASVMAFRAQRGPDAALRAAESIVRGMDTQARILSPAHGSITLALGDEHSITLRGDDENVIASENLPQSATIRLLALSEGGARSSVDLQMVSFDASGRSIDYVVEIRADDVVRRLAVAGLTGWIEGVEQ